MVDASFSLLQTNPQFATLILILVLWELFWKGIALWKAARESQRYWFIAILILNTVGILPILYIFLFKEGKKGIWIKKTNCTSHTDIQRFRYNLNILFAKSGSPRLLHKLQASLPFLFSSLIIFFSLSILYLFQIISIKSAFFSFFRS